MKFAMTQTAELDVTSAAVWAAWADVAAYPQWDPREVGAGIDGPFAVGTTGWSKQRGNPRATFRITALQDNRSWTTECPLPGGKLQIDQSVEPIGAGRVRVTKEYTAYGPMSVAFRLHFARRIRQAMPTSFAALGDRARTLAVAPTSTP